MSNLVHSRGIGVLREVLVLMVATEITHAAVPTPAEVSEARRWIAAKFEGVQETKAPETGLVVLANNDPVQRNARTGRPLRIANTEYARGLFCHAYSKVVVRLPGPGRTFTATIGVDSNEQTCPGRGSVVFSVQVGGKEAFRSEVLREGTQGRPIGVDLGGATEFLLEVGDAGDGIGCDQADWAEARVAMADGSALWLGDMVMEDPHLPAWSTEAPFSFTFDGRPSSELLKAWRVERTSKRINDQRTERTLVSSDSETGLIVRCLAVEYHDFPVAEWTLYFKNAGSADTPILEGILALDTVLKRYAWPETESAEFFLHHFTGSPCTPRDYEPHLTRLGRNAQKQLSAAGGRPTNSDLCYFNIEWPSEGVIIGIGWPGQWAAHFARDDAVGLRTRIGQELTHFKLQPGEEVRTPLVALLFWKGDWIRAQNLWRHWMLAHNLPRPGGKLPPAQMAACSSHQFGEMINANEENQKLFVDRYLEEGVKLDYWWMDAGWYVNQSGWPNTGTWEVDTKRFPRGLRAITDHAHGKGVKSIVWFEPERVTPGTWLYEHHPEWLLGREGEQKLLNLGNSEARKWLTDHVDKLLNEQGIDLYRNDFNIDPLGFWRANDAEDRQGVTEIRYVEGILAYWDELRRRHPNMLIDTCASGGRRNDLETLRRSVPLLRSDYILEPVSQQLHTYGIAFWFPFYGTGVNSTDPYVFRSQMCPHITGCYDVRNRDLNYAELRRLYGQWRSISPYYFGDYYPLASYHAENDAWVAWQFDRPDLGGGMVQVFRRADSIYESARFRLRGLGPESRYRVRNLDTERATEVTGRELTRKGLTITISEQPGSVLMTYKRVR